MEIRHLRSFIAVAEELHFARAAERLPIEQSPLSRTIKELEYDLSARLFERTARGTQLTWAGQVFLEDLRRVFATLEQAKINVKNAANGYPGMSRVAVSDGIAPSRMAALLARCRAEGSRDTRAPDFALATGQQLGITSYCIRRPPVSGRSPVRICAVLRAWRPKPAVTYPAIPCFPCVFCRPA